MALMIKLIFLDLWIILSAQQAKRPHSNWEKPKVFINFKKSCTGSENSENSYDSSVDGIFPVGCAVQLKCQYYDCMAKGNNTFLFIEIKNAELNRSVSLLARSGCDVEALITDVTMDFNDVKVFCRDLLHPQVNRTRTLTIGYPPVTPEIVSLMYSSKSISLTFDKVKTGGDLNDEDTKWSIIYDWREKCNCSSIKEDSRNMTCTIVLPATHNDGFYEGVCVGSLHNEISFTITAVNKFGKNETSKLFYLYNYLNPGKVGKPIPIESGKTWLHFKAHLTRHVYNACAINGAACDNLKLEYTVAKVSEEEEQRLTSWKEDFYQEYGIYRNLEDDEEAMARLNLTNFTYTNTVPWWNPSKLWMSINVTGLTPYSRYNISIRLIAQYEGLHNEGGGDSFNTSQDVPQEGPTFNISPYTCFMGQNSCASCVIYFKEIPRALRQSNVTNYTLEGNLEGSQRSMSNCKAGPSFKAYASGEANSVMVETLMPDSFYTLTLTAHTTVGSSQDSTYLLETSDFGDSVDVELEMKANLDVYKLFWNNARWKNNNDVTYYVHYCYSDKAFGSFNCKTNRVIEQTNGTSMSSHTKKVPKYFGSTAARKSLRPLFFLSVVENGKMSGLYPEKWRYDMDKAPGPVNLKYVMKSDSQPTDLQVMFERTNDDMDNPQHGRPTSFVIRWKKISEEQKQICGPSCAVSWTDGINTLKVDGYARGPFTLKDLKPSTLYCVGVRAEREGQTSPWSCYSTTTGQTGDASSSNPALIIVLVLVMFAVLTAAGVVYCQWRRRCRSMGDKMKVTWPHPPTWPCTMEDSPSPILPSEQGFENPLMVNSRSLHLLSKDSGIYDGTGDALFSESRPGDEAKVDSPSSLLLETGINSVFRHTGFLPTMHVVNESSAQASEEPDDRDSGEGFPRYGQVTAACSESASSSHGEREEEEENKWKNSRKKDVTEDKQITEFDMETSLEECDLDESAPKECDPEESLGMLTSPTDALNLSKLPNSLFHKSNSVVLYDPHEDSEDGEETKLVSQQNTCARSGHCNSGSADVESWLNVDKSLTMSQQTLTCSNGKESGFDSEDGRSDSDANRYSLVLKSSCSLEVLQDTKNFQNQRTPCNTAVVNLENNVKLPPQIQGEVSLPNVAASSQAGILKQNTMNGHESNAACPDQSMKFPSGLNIRLPLDRKTANSVPPHIFSILKGVAASKMESVEKNCMATAQVEQALHVYSPKTSSQRGGLGMQDQEVGQPSGILSLTHVPHIVSSLSACPKGQALHAAPTGPAPESILKLLKPNKANDRTNSVLRSEAAEKQTIVKEHMGGFFSEDQVLVEEGHKDADMCVKNGPGPFSTEAKKEQILKAGAAESVFKGAEHSRHGRSESNSKLLSSNPLKDSGKKDIISHPSSTDMVELENQVKRNVVPRAEKTLADKCKSAPIHRKQKSYCKVTSLSESL